MRLFNLLAKYNNITTSSYSNIVSTYRIVSTAVLMEGSEY